jgi:hypothetical protein
MNRNQIRRPVGLAIAGTAALALALGGTAVADTFITGKNVRDNSIHSVDVATNTLTYADIANGSVRGIEIANATLGYEKFSENAITRMRDGIFTGEHWGVILRNTQAGGSAMLRSGPYAGPQDAEGAVSPPRGIGSLQIQTGDGDRDKVAYGNEVDFAGDKLADIDEVGFSVFTTGENANAAHGGNGVNNLPNITFEVDPNIEGNASNYSSLVFVPKGSADFSNRWHTYDATEEDDGEWWFTGAAGTATGCDHTSMCTWAQIQEEAPAATLYTAAVAKGTDDEFQGAVDELTVGEDTYDFEPRGVIRH